MRRRRLLPLLPKDPKDRLLSNTMALLRENADFVRTYIRLNLVLSFKLGSREKEREREGEILCRKTNAPYIYIVPDPIGN